MLCGAQVAEALVEPLLVVPANPVADLPAGMLEVLEHVLPNALLLQGTKEALDDAVLLQGVGSDELLGKSIVSHGDPETAALEDKAVVTPHDGSLSLRADGAEVVKAGRFQRPFGFFGPAAEGKLIAHHLAVVAVEESHQVPPAVLAAVDVGHTSMAQRSLLSPARLMRPLARGRGVCRRW